MNSHADGPMAPLATILKADKSMKQKHKGKRHYTYIVPQAATAATVALYVTG